MTKIAFWDNGLGERGTSVALYDYAHYNETILNNESIIIYNNTHYSNNIQSINKFKNRFKVFDVDHWSKVDTILSEEKCDIIYIIKAGDWDGQVSNVCKNVIHCVFTTCYPHGEVYTPIGQNVNYLQGSNFPVLPHIVTLPESDTNLRSELNIPENSIVFGRYGGKNTFDIQFVYNEIQKILEVRNDIYFLFLNTNEFYHHKNIIYLPGSCDMIYKRTFINTCDALLHARDSGESFGLTCGEFAICEKPVITYGKSNDKEHLLILKDKAVIYNSPEELYNILNTFTKDKYDVKNNGYMFYTPENVMNIFEKICLQ